MNTKPAADFFAPPAPPRTTRVSGETFDRLCASLNLDASSAETSDVERELTKLGEAAKAKEAGHALTPVSRRGPLTLPLVTRTRAKAAKAMRAAPVRRASMRPR